MRSAVGIPIIHVGRMSMTRCTRHRFVRMPGDGVQTPLDSCIETAMKSECATVWRMHSARFYFAYFWFSRFKGGREIQG
jgi:hypothetical protein